MVFAGSKAAHEKQIYKFWISHFTDPTLTSYTRSRLTDNWGNAN